MRRSAVGPQRRRGSNSRQPWQPWRKGIASASASWIDCGRTMVEVVNRLHDLQSRGIHVKTLDGLLDTRSLGKMAPLVIGLLTGLAECERSRTDCREDPGVGRAPQKDRRQPWRTTRTPTDKEGPHHQVEGGRQFPEADCLLNRSIPGSRAEDL